MKNLGNQLADLAWTIGGVGLVLITLSGDTLKWGIWISIASLVTYLIGQGLQGDEES